jgi:hypothetical protein
MYIPKWGSNFFFTFPTSEGSDLLSSHVMQTPTFISKLSDENVIFRLDVGKKYFQTDLFILIDYTGLHGLYTLAENCNFL